MQPPRFWFNSPDAPGWQARLLAPLAALYAGETARRQTNQGYRAGVPVICIGNLNAGGTGKTPTAIAMAQHLMDRGRAVHIVTRGYKGRLEGPIRVDETRHTADQTGDEPLLLAAFTATWVAKDRAAGVRAAEDAGADVILLDDGFQNPGVHKDLSLLVIDAGQAFGNERVMPAGPLREPIEAGAQRAHASVVIGPPAQRQAFAARYGDRLGLPLVDGHLAPLQTGMDWDGLRVLAFAGIGRPAKFFATLREAGAELVHGESLDDHQPLTPALMARLEQHAASLGAQLVTTEKDAVRLPASFRAKVITLPVRLDIQDWSAIDALLARLLP